ncbi:hypothetical protein ACLMJK_001343 [Lecanora helva]
MSSRSGGKATREGELKNRGASSGGKGSKGGNPKPPSVCSPFSKEIAHDNNSEAQPRSPSSSASIPPYLSFVFSIEALKPDYSTEPRHQTTTGSWAPPSARNGYESTSRSLWRWQGGRVLQVLGSDPVLRAQFHRYATATLFSQDPDTPHLLVVPFDARTRNVRDYGAGWQPITFDHIRLDGIGVPREYFSSVSPIGAESKIAAPSQGFWMPQLLPHWYNYRAAPNSQPRSHAGLIGNLPILLALAAFSAPAVYLSEAMSSIQPGAWRPHRHQYPAGHSPPERGMVVSVFLDPLNPEHSSEESLNRLAEGVFGPFYGRTPSAAPSPAVTTSRGFPSGSSGYPSTPSFRSTGSSSTGTPGLS